MIKVLYGMTLDVVQDSAIWISDETYPAFAEFDFKSQTLAKVRQTGKYS